MGSGGLTGDLSALVGKTDTTLGHLDDAAGVGREILDRVDTLLQDIRELDDTIQDRVPGLRATLQDTRTLVSDMVITIDDTHGFLTSFRSLARTTGEQLDAGTKKSLENLAATLRKTARSTNAVGDVKTAKDTINDIIEDTWNEYTGDINDLLLMDATAPAVSLTSGENPSPTSIQVRPAPRRSRRAMRRKRRASKRRRKGRPRFGTVWRRCSGISGTPSPGSSAKV